MRPQIRIGISGWTYPGWRHAFYPPALPHRAELEYASRQVNSIEINGTFYSLQTPISFEKWNQSVPDDFIFSIKGGRLTLRCSFASGTGERFPPGRPDGFIDTSAQETRFETFESPAVAGAH